MLYTTGCVGKYEQPGALLMGHQAPVYTAPATPSLCPRASRASAGAHCTGAGVVVRCGDGMVVEVVE